MTYATYEEYIDSKIDWIGLIPSSWSLLKSKFIFNRINIQSTTGDEELLSVSEYYGVKPKKETIDEGDFISRAESLIGYKKCSKNDLVMNIMLAWKKGLGVTNYDGIVSPAYEIFNINMQLAYPRYMNYLLRTDLYASEFKRHSYGVIDSRLRLYPDNFKEIECILPSIEEQKQIANYLDKQTSKIDSTIAKNKELIQLLGEKRTALINQVVTKGLNPDVPMKDSGIEWIGEIPEQWNITKVRFLGTLQNGISKSSQFFGHGYPFISYGDVYNNEELPQYISGKANTTISERVNYSVQKNDIFFTRTSETIDEVGITSLATKTIENATFSGFLIRLRLFKNINININFLKYYLQSVAIRHYFAKMMIIVTRASLGQNLLNNLNVLLPPIEEQEQIVGYLDKEISKIDKIIFKIKENIQLLDEYKTSLIHHVVTGKIDVMGEEI